jgi:hypothetical protein
MKIFEEIEKKNKDKDKEESDTADEKSKKNNKITPPI